MVGLQSLGPRSLCGCNHTKILFCFKKKEASQGKLMPILCWGETSIHLLNWFVGWRRPTPWKASSWMWGTWQLFAFVGHSDLINVAFLLWAPSPLADLFHSDCGIPSLHQSRVLHFLSYCLCRFIILFLWLQSLFLKVFTFLLCFSCYQEISETRAEEMSQDLRALTALAKDWGGVSSTHMTTYNCPWLSS